MKQKTNYTTIRKFWFENSQQERFFMLEILCGLVGIVFMLTGDVVSAILMYGAVIPALIGVFMSKPQIKEEKWLVIKQRGKKR